MLSVNRVVSGFLFIALFAISFMLVNNNAVAQTETLQEIAGQLFATQEPTTIYLAKEFITMNSVQPRVEAVAVRKGRFVAAGTRAEVSTIVGQGATVDSTFSGKIVTAGFIEQHVHPVLVPCNN